MLETDEVDVDFFTPAEGTSLASIFGKNTQPDEAKDTPTLKYVPPPPPTSKPEVKPTQWIFTCAVHGFEWSNSGYISKGRLGLAILKVVKTNGHSIILYDSNKTTVSFVTISPKLKIHKRDALTVSYYDNAQKYWSIQTSDDDMNNMLQLLQNLQATIVHKSFQETDREQSDNNKIDNKDNTTIQDSAQKEEKEIDTDSYMNQKTKDSILKRMANMGHSVLPTHGVTKGQTSDSSDSDEIDGGKKNVRHKPSKSVPKRSADLNIQDTEGNIPSHSRKPSHKSHIDGQSPVSMKTGNTTPCNGDMNMFISEQRMSNSELRINVNRMSDKIDLVLERLNYTPNIDKSNSISNFQNDIIQKLIREYESKIKNYEDFMTSQGIDCHSIRSTVNIKENTDDCHDNDVYKNRIEELEKECRKKDTVITTMENEIKVLHENNNKIIEDNRTRMEELLKEIQTLNVDLSDKNKQIENIKKDNINTSNQDTGDIAGKIKKIMNDTFQAISVNFDDEEKLYTGKSIQAVIAAVIKKTTIEALKELK
ncbi:uncharacterized protein [Epargyreus clarus]|uniref:uncharacterized protein n=1 Tax=Epargyreus clarus TaxID=520877 RepID=UPI003C2D9491